MEKILVTGGAGFIGSNLISKLLDLGYQVKCYDNLATGSLANLSEFENSQSFEFVNADIRDFEKLKEESKGCKYILHQAALGSVPRSINDPLTSNDVNVSGTLNVFYAAVENNIERVVYAASSSTYGDSKALPKQEDVIGKPLSPYAVTKVVNEIYADVFFKIYGLKSVGLRYFNVFGPNQSPNGPYAAVIPKFMEAVFNNQAPTINGDGEHSRDFTFVANVVQANINAMKSENILKNEVVNIAYGERTTLNELYDQLKVLAGSEFDPIYGPERPGDVKHSLADISKAKELINYNPGVSVREGLKETYTWFKNLSAK